jgi:hypothetical protein
VILGILLLLGGIACLVAGFRRLRRPQGGDAPPRLVIAPAQGSDEPRILLRRGDGIAFGPHPARWDPARSMATSGTWRVIAALDLAGKDALGTGDAALAGRLGDALGRRALVLEPLSGGRPLLLHAGGSAGGIGIAPRHLDGLLAMLGNPAGLEVELVRRRVRRAGWGAAQGHRRRGRQ